MAISDADIVYYRSANGSSEGGARSVTEIVDAVANALFPNISDAERAAGGTLYRKFFATNEHPTDAMIQPKAWIEAPPVGMAEHIAVGFDDADDDEAVLSGNMTAWTATAAVAAVSDGADTRTVTVIGVTGAGVPLQEVITLNGTTEVLSVATFSKVHAVLASAKDAGRTVTIRQGASGTTRGLIHPNRGSCFLWQNPATKVAAILLPNLTAGASIGFWDRLVWSAGISAQRPADSIFALEEA